MDLKSIFFISIFLGANFFINAQNSSPAQFNDAVSLIVYIEGEIKKTKRFDRNLASEQIREKMKLSKIPSMPMDFDMAIAKATLEDTEKQYPESLKKTIEEQAKKKFPLLAVGEEVVIPVRWGRGYIDYRGKIKAIVNRKIHIGSKVVLFRDLPEHILDRMNPEKIASSIECYVNQNYTEPKKNWKSMAEKRIKKEFRKKYGDTYRFHRKLKKKEKAHYRPAREEIFKKILPEFIRKRQMDRLKAHNVKIRLARSILLLNDLRILEKKYGKLASKIINANVDRSKLSQGIDRLKTELSFKSNEFRNRHKDVKAISHEMCENIGYDVNNFKRARDMYHKSLRKPFDKTAKKLIDEVSKIVLEQRLPEAPSTLKALDNLNPYRHCAEVKAAVKEWVRQWGSQLKNANRAVSPKLLIAANHTYKAGDLPVASLKYVKLLEAAPGNLDARNNFALCQLHLNNDLIAQVAFEINRQLNPQYSPSLINLTVVYERLGRHEEAKKLALKTFEKNHQIPAARYNVAWYLNLQGDFQLTKKLLQPIAYPEMPPKYRELLDINDLQLKAENDKVDQ